MWSPDDGVSTVFVLPSPDAPKPDEPLETPETPETDGSSHEAPANEEVLVELRGLVAAEGHEPQFAMRIIQPGGREQTLDLSPGGVVYGPWCVREYNRELQTVTLSNGDDFLVLHRGEALPLPGVKPWDGRPKTDEDASEEEDHSTSGL